MKCDICNDENNIIAGRWIFYCSKHEYIDKEKTYTNEIEPCLESGEMPDAEALEMML